MVELKKNTLIDEFIQNSALTTTTTSLIKRDSSSISKALRESIGTHKEVLIGEFSSIDKSLLSEFIETQNIIRHPNENNFQSAQIGITDSFAGISKTGSVCVSLHNRITSAISMLAKKHIVLLDSNYIVQLPREIFLNEKFKNNNLTNNFTFITGPSATADMGPLVRGVHGPGQLHIIIIE